MNIKVKGIEKRPSYRIPVKIWDMMIEAEKMSGNDFAEIVRKCIRKSVRQNIINKLSYVPKASEAGTVLLTVRLSEELLVMVRPYGKDETEAIIKALWSVLPGEVEHMRLKEPSAFRTKLKEGRDYNADPSTIIRLLTTKNTKKHEGGKVSC